MYTNRTNLPLPIAIWLASDTYDHDPRSNHISATSLLKPTKSLILTSRLKQTGESDILDFVPSRTGTAVHDSIEQALNGDILSVCRSLDIPAKVAKDIKINPENPSPDDHNIYCEIRSEREIDGYVISGKFDVVEDGEVADAKTTKVYNWIMGGNDLKYAQQGSIYRWLNQDIITKDTMKVYMIFTDWNALEAQRNKEYPHSPVMVRELKLMSLEETEQFIRDKLKDVTDQFDLDQADMRPCTPEELWQSDPTWAFYTKRSNKRATKNCSSKQEADALVAEKGGVVVYRPGQVKFCTYCPASGSCMQAESYRQQGLLK